VRSAALPLYLDASRSPGKDPARSAWQIGKVRERDSPALEWFGNRFIQLVRFALATVCHSVGFRVRVGSAPLALATRSQAASFQSFVRKRPVRHAADEMR
jgi:hypothetical protein